MYLKSQNTLQFCGHCRFQYLFFLYFQFFPLSLGEGLGVRKYLFLKYLYFSHHFALALKLSQVHFASHLFSLIP